MYSHTGPAESLLHRPYFEAMKRALKPGGLICVLGKYTCSGNARKWEVIDLDLYTTWQYVVGIF